MSPNESLAWLLAADQHPEVKNETGYAEALNAMEADETLRRRLEEAQAFDKEYDTLVSTATLPEDARHRILAVIEKAERDQIQSKTIAFPWQQQLAKAAIAILLVGGAFFAGSKIMERGVLQTQNTLATFQHDVEGFQKLGAFMADGNINLQHRNSDFDNVSTWLAEQKGVTIDAPRTISSSTSMGCQIIDWNGSKVSVVCVKLEGNVAHLFVTDLETFQGHCPEKFLGRRTVDGRESQTWVKDGKAYFLVTHDEGEPLPEIAL